MRAVCRLERSSDTSLMAMTSCVRPRVLIASMRNGVRLTCRAFLRRCSRPASLKVFIRKPMVPRFMP